MTKKLEMVAASEVDNVSLGRSMIADGVSDILCGLSTAYGLDITDPNFAGTPERVARAYEELFSGLRNTDGQVASILKTAFPCDSDQMIIQKDIWVTSMCPHHVLPVFLNIAVAYLPGPKGGVLGLSKLSRLVEILAKRPILQERLGNDITTKLMTLPKVLGAACLISGVHCCMMIRGVRQREATTITSSIAGIFKSDPSVKAEFFALVNGK